jgi:hypothetical protein
MAKMKKTSPIHIEIPGNTDSAKSNPSPVTIKAYDNTTITASNA